MVSLIEIKPPFLINPLKHHISFPRLLLQKKDVDQNDLVKELKKGGNLLCDYYYGECELSEIIKNLKFQLEERHILDQSGFLQHISSLPKHYFNLRISDGSEWTLLKGVSKERYIHIHPARYSPKTIRVRFLALKTALLLKYFYNTEEKKLSYDLINHVRKEYLNESPVKLGGNIDHIRRIISLLDKCL